MLPGAFLLPAPGSAPTEERRGNGMMAEKYAKLKKLHPNAKVRSIKRLIKAIGDSEIWEIEMIKAIQKPKKAGGEIVTRSLANQAIKSAAELGKAGIPMAFDMTDYMTAPENPFIHGVSDAPLAKGGFRICPTCGTAACIAGFAGALAARSGTDPRSAEMRRLNGVLRNGQSATDSASSASWTQVLADFMGIDGDVANKMISVRHSSPDFNEDVKPRHAVKLLEKFLETGRVDWDHAMGRRKVGTRLDGQPMLELTAKEMKMRERERKMLAEMAHGLRMAA